MRNFQILTDSINYIECHLCQRIMRIDVARNSYVSLSMLEKLFRYALHMSIQEYIHKRRMTQAARDVLKTNNSITEIAMKYQFNSVEVFSRAFKRVWSVNPSEFKDKWKFTGIFPKINYEYKEGEDLSMARRKVDMSEAYDYFRERKGSYVLCFDAKNLSAINALSRKAGDVAILEEALRIDRAATEDMMLMRIGGDEFALLTGLYDLGKVKELQEAVLSHNGETIAYEAHTVELSLWCGITTIPECLRYAEFFTEMHQSIMNSKQ